MSRKFRQFLFSTTDFYGNSVTLSEETWSQHIVVEHPDMVGLERVVQQTVEDPYRIFLSTQSPTGLAYASEPGAGTHPEGIRVIVKYADTAYEKGATSGKVSTAYPVDMVKFGRPQVGKKIYQRRLRR